MKLWHIKVKERDDWQPFPPQWMNYDTVMAAVVRAETEDEARHLVYGLRAEKDAGDEDKPALADWLNREYVDCTELPADGDPGVIVADIHES